MSNDKAATLKRIGELGLVAVLRGPAPDVTLRMVDALLAGGVMGIEITYTTPKAAEVVRELDRRHAGAILLGMGTLTDPAQVAEARSAGARFIVSPHCEPELGRAMTGSGLAAMIGAFTPSEVFAAWKLGADVVKIFPGTLAGPGYLKNLKGPFPQIATMPTGGVSVENVGEWFAAGAFAVGVGSELCPPAAAKAGKWEEITATARQFVAAVAAARQRQAGKP